jgi:hypothetical protein
MTIPYNIDYGQRNAVLLELASDVVAAGGSVNSISALAGETHPNWVLFINQLNAATNALGANPPLKIYQWLDYSAFQSVVDDLIQALHPIANPPPIVNPTNFNVTLPASNTSGVGTVSSSPAGATGFTIVNGNAAGYFMISGGGQLLTSATGSNMIEGVYTLGITCRNANGTSDPGNVTVTAA